MIAHSWNKMVIPLLLLLSWVVITMNMTMIACVSAATPSSTAADNVVSVGDMSGVSGGSETYYSNSRTRIHSRNRQQRQRRRRQQQQQQQQQLLKQERIHHNAQEKIPRFLQQETPSPSTTNGGYQTCELEKEFYDNDTNRYDCDCRQEEREIIINNDNDSIVTIVQDVIVLHCVEIGCTYCNTGYDVCGTYTENVIFDIIDGNQIGFSYTFQYETGDIANIHDTITIEELTITTPDDDDDTGDEPTTTTSSMMTCSVIVDDVQCTSCRYCNDESLLFDIDCSNIQSNPNSNARFNECSTDNILTFGNDNILQIFNENEFNQCIPSNIKEPPSNDMCSNATLIETSTSGTTTTSVVGHVYRATSDVDILPTNSTSSSTTSCSYGSGEIGVWYTIVGTGNILHLSTCSNITTFRTLLSVYTSENVDDEDDDDTDDDCDALQCVDNVTINDFPECSHSYRSSSTFSFFSEFNTVYRIFVSNDPEYVDGIGTFELHVTDIEISSNDSCETAIDIFPGDTIISGTTEFAPPGVFGNPCFVSANFPTGIWYRIRGLAGGTYRATTCNFLTDFDSRIMLYSGGGTSSSASSSSAAAAACDSLECVGFSRSFSPGCSAGGTILEWPTNPGVEYYYLLVHGNTKNETGTFGLTVTQFEPPANDICDDAEPISAFPSSTTSITGTTNSATFDELPECGLFSDTPGVWYSLDLDGSTEGVKGARVSTCSLATNFDTVLAVYSGSSCGSLDCVDENYDDLGCDANPFSSTVTWFVNASVTYYIYVSGELFNDIEGVGDFELSVTLFDPPPNDNCEGSIFIDISTSGSATVEGSTEDATPELDNVPFCPDLIDRGVWYTMKGRGKAIMASTCTENLDYNAPFSLHTGTCDGLQCIAGDLDASDCLSGRQLAWFAEENVDYFIVVQNSIGGGGGKFNLTLEEIETAPNDLCRNSVLTPTDGSLVVGSTDEATLDELSADFTRCPNFSSSQGGGLFYKIIGTGSVLKASSCTVETTSEVSLTVFSGTCGNLACMAEGTQRRNCDFYEFAYDVYWQSEQGVEYLVYAEGKPWSSGTFGLSVTEVEPPPGNTCEGATLIESFDGRIILGSLFASTIDGNYTVIEESECSLEPAPDAWYTITTTRRARLTATLCGKDTPFLDTVLDLYSGSCGALTCVTNSDDAECGIASQLTWDLVEAQYYLRVRGFAGQRGDFGLRVTSEDFAINDSCEGATEVTELDGSVLLGTTAMSTPDSDEASCFQTGITNGVWYRFNATGDGEMLRVSTCSFLTEFSTAIAVYAGSCESFQCVGFTNSFDSACSGGSTLEWPSTPGETYYILINSVFADSDGQFGIFVEQFTPPENDVCERASPLEASGSSLIGSTLYATFDDQPPCGPQLVAPGVWYRIEGFEGGIKLSTCSDITDYETELYVYSSSDGSCGNLTCVVSGYENTECAPNPYSSAVAWVAETSALTYYVLVYGRPRRDVGVGYFELMVEPFNPPENDVCSGAIPIVLDTSGTGTTIVEGTTTDATSETSDVPYCGDEFAGVWYSLVGRGTGIKASVCSPTTLTFSLSLFSGACDDLECVAESSPDILCDSSAFGGQLFWYGEEGAEYFLLVRIGANGATGSFSLTLEEQETAPNDSCSNPEQISPRGEEIIGSTLEATFDIIRGDLCGFPASGGGLWYKVIGTGGGIKLSTCSSRTTTGIAMTVFTGTCEFLTCITDDFVVDCGNNGGSASELLWTSVEGEEYLVLAQGLFDSSIGTFGLSVTTFEPLENDMCSNATMIETTDGSVILGSTLFATPDSSDYGFGTCSSAVSADVWYAVYGQGPITASLCGDETDFDTKISIFTGTCDRLECVANNDDTCSLASEVSWQAVEGTRYLIRIFGFGTFRGNFGLRLFGEIGSSNDQCQLAKELDLSNGSIYEAGSTETATLYLVGIDNCGAPIQYPGVWYKLQGTGTTLRASTCTEATTYSTALSIFSGMSCDDLSCEDGNTDDALCSLANEASTVAWSAELGMTYYILVHGDDFPPVGDFGLTIDSVTNTTTSSTNDACENAEALSLVDGSVSVLSSTIDATRQSFNAAPCNLFVSNSQGVWYSIVGTGTGMAASTICERTTFDSHLAVFVGGCQENNLTCIQSDDDSGCALASSLKWHSIEGVMYYIFVFGSFPDEAGDFELTVAEFDTADNDVCRTAIPIVPGSAAAGSTISATIDLGLGGKCGDATRVTTGGVWYSTIGDGTTYSASTCNNEEISATKFDTQISIFTGSCGVGDDDDYDDGNVDIEKLSCVVGNDQFCDDQSYVEWDTIDGEEYYILIHGWSIEEGDFELKLESLATI